MITWIWVASVGDMQRSVVACCPRFTQAQDACRHAVLSAMDPVHGNREELAVLKILLDNIADVSPITLCDIPDYWPPAILLGGASKPVEYRITGKRTAANR